MSRPVARATLLTGGFPRVSGDEPEPGLIVLEGSEFSPRERG